MDDSIRVGRYVIKISNLQKVLFPQDHITKVDLLNYYAAVAPLMLPYWHNRMVSMQRFPAGIDQEGFFQKDAPEYFPSWIKRIEVKKQEAGITHYIICNNLSTLIYLVNNGTITMHLGLSKIDRLYFPDQMIFDLDPSQPNDFEQVKWIAFELKALLESYNLIPFVKTTGGKGVHIVVPIKRKYMFDEVRAFAKQCAEQLVKKYPGDLTLEMHKDQRKNKLFIDTLRNAFGQTVVAPYAVRARDGAPIAFPISWKELQVNVTHAQQFTVPWVLKTMKKRLDPWQNIIKSSRLLPTRY